MAKRKYKPPFEPRLPPLDEPTLQEMRSIYRRIRRDVYEKATRLPDSSAAHHAESQRLLRSYIETICKEADLAPFSSNAEAERKLLWHHMWSKLRHEQVPPELANEEIASTKHLFDDYLMFCRGDWSVGYTRSRVTTRNGRIKTNRKVDREKTGRHAREYFDKTGPFSLPHIRAHGPKLERTVRFAQQFKKYFDEYPTNPAIHYVANRIDPKHIWRVHNHLTKVRKYTGGITALHLMMDIGYNVMKPDKVMAIAYFQLGWLQLITDLPSWVTESDLTSGKDGGDEDNWMGDEDEDAQPVDSITSSTPSKKATSKNSGPSHYTDERIYKPIVELSRRIALGMRKEDLVADIGWATSNPLREFDLFMVKYGAKPHPAHGLHRTLHDTKPFSTFLEATA